MKNEIIRGAIISPARLKNQFWHSTIINIIISLLAFYMVKMANDNNLEKETYIFSNNMINFMKCFFQIIKWGSIVVAICWIIVFLLACIEKIELKRLIVCIIIAIEYIGVFMFLQSWCINELNNIKISEINENITISEMFFEQTYSNKGMQNIKLEISEREEIELDYIDCFL